MTSRPSRGFSLVEVMVALVVVAIGLLGLAKMESLAMASTSVAGTRSIAAMQAASMAAAMHANRNYWGSTVVNPSTSFKNTPALAATACTSAASPCTPAAMAAYDLQTWQTSMNATLPTYLVNIDCTAAVVPVNCTITIRWTENSVAVNAQQTNLANLKVPTYQVYVEP